jgi:hypothetical protein
MEDPNQKPQTGDRNEEFHASDHDDIGSNSLPDGYAGDRARMVLDSQGDAVFGTVSGDPGDTKLGPLERLVSTFLSLFFLVALIISIVIIPIPLVGYAIYDIITRLISKILRKWE